MSKTYKTSHINSRRTKVDKVIYRGSGAAILGSAPGIRTKAEANRVIDSMLGRQPQA